MKKYFDGETHKGFYAFLSSRLLLRVVAGLLGIFGQIFIYKIAGDSIFGVLWFVAIGSLMLLVALPIGMKVVNKIGFIRSLQVSSVVAALYHLFYFLTDMFTIPFLWFVVGAATLLTVYKILYWIPFHTEFFKLSNKKNRSRQVSFFEATALVLSIFLPAIAAYVISRYGYPIVFMVAILVMIISIFPYAQLRKMDEDDAFTWTVKETWQMLYKEKNTKMTFSFFAVGMESVINLFIWPIFLYQVFDGNLLNVGIVSSLIIAITAILQLVAGKYIDAFHRGDKVLQIGSVMYSIGWIAKIFIVTAVDVFIAGAYHQFSRIATLTPMGSMHYDLSSEQEEYIDEYNVLREMYISIGRIVAVIISMIILSFMGIQWLFVLGALSALAFNFTSSKDMLLKKKPLKICRVDL